MQTDNYRANLINALRNLRAVNESIFDSMVDIIMAGELKEWNDSVPIGEVHELNWDFVTTAKTQTFRHW